MEVETVFFGLTFLTPARLSIFATLCAVAGALLSVYARALRRRF